MEQVELIRKEREHRREIAVLMDRNEATPVAHHVSASNKLGVNPSSGSIFGEGRGHRHGSAVLMAKNETILSATTQDVVEVALCASPSNKLGIIQSNGSILLG
jgi:hypothetical protein